MSEYKSCLDELDDLIFRLSQLGQVVIGGDFNAHIGKIGGPRSFDSVNRKGLVMRALVEKHSLISLNSQESAKGPIETYTANEGTCLTTVDHIMIMESYSDLVLSCEVKTDHCLNMSYHYPIACVLQMPVTHSTEHTSRKTQTDWNAIKNDKILSRYKHCVNHHLHNLINYQTEITTIDEIETTTSNITRALLSAATDLIPNKKFKKYLKPHWKNGLGQAHKKVRKLRNLWIRHGRPRNMNNPFFIDYKNAKREFHKILRRKAYEYEINEFGNIADTFDSNRCSFQKIMSKKRTKANNRKSKLKEDGRIVSDEKELLSI